NLDIPVHLLARELKIEVSLRDIYSGKALSVMLPRCNLAHEFPRVCVLQFWITSVRVDLDITRSSLGVQQNISAFATHIKKMLPRIHKISVSYCDIICPLLRATVPFLGELVSQLYQLAGNVEYCLGCETMPVVLQPGVALNLTSMDCHLDTSIGSFLTLARQNAPTLQYLSITSLGSVDVSGLVREPGGGGYVQYISICTLKLRLMTSLDISRRAVFGRVKPFANLRRLDIRSKYPFGDDLLFRGNAKTLEYLTIRLEDSLVSIIQRHDVFTPVSHPKLHRIIALPDQRRLGGYGNTTSDYLRLTLGISSSAPICSFYNVTGVLGQHYEPSLFDQHQHIKILWIPNVRLTLWYTLDLIRALPLLTALRTMDPVPGPAPCGIVQDRLPEYLILDFVTSNSRLLDAGISKGSILNWRMLAPILTVCPSFTPVALAQMFERFSIRLTNPLDFHSNIPIYQLCSPEEVIAYACRWTRTIVIFVDILDVYSGAAREWLLSKPYADWKFLKARSVRFVFFMPQILEEPVASAIASSDSELNISAFVQRVRQVVPVAMEISVSLKAGLSDMARFPTELLGSFVSQLSQNAAVIDYKFGYQPEIVDLQLGGLRSLTYNSMNTADGGKQVVALAQNNAATLQVLEISVHIFTGMTSLIRCPDGSYVQYPCLQTLQLQDQPRVDAPRLPEFPGAVPFPSLRQLALDGEFYFGDDTVFRGNAATLESLTLLLDSRTAMFLRNHRVFTPLSHPKLHYVDIAVDDDSELGFFETRVDCVKFVLSIGPSAPVRAIQWPPSGPEIQSAISVFGEYACIQVLQLPSLLLNLWDAIALVKALPLLSDLYAPCPDLGPLPHGVAKHKLPAYVIANYAPMGKHFRCWHLESLDHGSTKKVVRCILLLALVCPSFDYAAIDPFNRQSFMAHMKQLITTDGFRPHALRLRRLLFGGRENEIRSLKTIQRENEAEQLTY
ncbi:hypothetical protein IWW57_002025, partial [Coemansia sp. S610]